MGTLASKTTCLLPALTAALVASCGDADDSLLRSGGGGDGGPGGGAFAGDGGDAGDGGQGDGGVAGAAGAGGTAGGGGTGGSAGSGGRAGGAGSGGTSGAFQTTLCRNSLDCSSTPGAAPICDPSLGLCVECAGAADCGDNAQCVERQCVTFTPCESSLECPGGEVCDAVRGRCFECVADPDCSDELVCRAGTCHTPCQSDNQCTPFGQLCDFGRGHCVECLSDGDCEAEAYCKGGACEADRCTGGASLCTSAGVVRCADNGSQLLAAEPCGGRQACVEDAGAASCVSWVCTAGATECASDTELVECATDGLSIVSTTDCSQTDQYCVSGACSDQICAAGELYCASGEVRLCDADGLGWTVSQTCTAGQYCDAADPSCKTQVCAPDAPACNGNAVTTCNSTGSGFVSAGTPCPTDQYCVAGACGSAVFTDDFEDGDASDWTSFVGFPGYSTASHSAVTTQAAAGTYSLELTVSNLLTSFTSGASNSFQSTAVTSASFWIRPAATTATFTLRAGTETVLSVGVSSTGAFTINGVTTATNYTADQWYQVEIRNIDWTGHTFDVYVGGSLLGQDSMQITTATGVDTVRLGATPTTSTTVYWDEIVIG